MSMSSDASTSTSDTARVLSLLTQHMPQQQPTTTPTPPPTTTQSQQQVQPQSSSPSPSAASHEEHKYGPDDMEYSDGLESECDDDEWMLKQQQAQKRADEHAIQTSAGGWNINTPYHSIAAVISSVDEAREIERVRQSHGHRRLRREPYPCAGPADWADRVISEIKSVGLVIAPDDWPICATLTTEPSVGHKFYQPQENYQLLVQHLQQQAIQLDRMYRQTQTQIPTSTSTPLNPANNNNPFDLSFAPILSNLPSNDASHLFAFTTWPPPDAPFPIHLPVFPNETQTQTQTTNNQTNQTNH